jgi:hypothetical protein
MIKVLNVEEPRAKDAGAAGHAEASKGVAAAVN